MVTLYSYMPSAVRISHLAEDERRDFWHFVNELTVEGTRRFAVRSNEGIKKIFSDSEFKEEILLFAEAVSADVRRYNVTPGEDGIESIEPSERRGEAPHIIGRKVRKGRYKTTRKKKRSKNVDRDSSINRHKGVRDINVERLRNQEKTSPPPWVTHATEDTTTITFESEIADNSITQSGIQTETWNIPVENLPVSDPTEYVEISRKNGITVLKF